MCFSGRVCFFSFTRVVDSGPSRMHPQSLGRQNSWENHMFPFNFGSVLWDLWDPSPSEAKCQSIHMLLFSEHVPVWRGTLVPPSSSSSIFSSSLLSSIHRGADFGPIAWWMPFSSTVCQIWDRRWDLHLSAELWMWHRRNRNEASAPPLVIICARRYKLWQTSRHERKALHQGCSADAEPFMLHFSLSHCYLHQSRSGLFTLASERQHSTVDAAGSAHMLMILWCTTCRSKSN